MSDRDAKAIPQQRLMQAMGRAMLVAAIGLPISGLLFTSAVAYPELWTDAVRVQELTMTLLLMSAATFLVSATYVIDRSGGLA